MAFHRGPLLQRGYGLGGIFASLFKRIIPIGKAFIQSKTGQTLKDIGVQAASNTISEIIGGRNVRESAKENLSDAKKRIGTLIKEKIENRDQDSSDEEEPKPKKIKRDKTSKASGGGKKKRKKKSKKKFNLLK